MSNENQSTEHQYVRDRADPLRTGRIVDIDGLVDGLPTPETRFKIEWDATWQRASTFELSPGDSEGGAMSKKPPDGETFQLVVTPSMRPIIDSIAEEIGMVLVPMPVIGPDGQPTLDPDYWPGDDVPTYALHPA